MVTDAVAPIAGGLILLLLGVDVFYTVLHPDGHGGPVTSWHNRVVWSLWRRLAPRGRGRAAWFGLAGPALSALAPAVWALLLVAGFALLFYPGASDFLVSPGTLRGSWVEALYVSGFAAATLGTGDVVPDAVPYRLLTIIEALSGFALLSAALSYITSIHSEHALKTTLASDVAAHFEAARRDGGDPWQRDRWLEGVAERMLRVMHAHAQYPILHYFRPTDHRDSLTLQVQPFVERHANGGSPDSRSHAEHAALVAVERHLTAANERFIPGQRTKGEGPLSEKYDRLVEYLAYSPSPRLGEQHE